MLEPVYTTHTKRRTHHLPPPPADFVRLLMTVGVGLLLGLIYMNQVGTCFAMASLLLLPGLLMASTAY